MSYKSQKPIHNKGLKPLAFHTNDLELLHIEDEWRREAPPLIFLVLQQLPIKRTTTKSSKVLQNNAFELFIGWGLSAKRCMSQAKLTLPYEDCRIKC